MTTHRNYLINLLLALFALGFALFGSIGLDRLVGFYAFGAPIKAEEGLVFPPHSQFHYKTPEFEFDASINSLGIRDHEINIKKGDAYRILAIGDSFTYGWGVDLYLSWPKVLEHRLQDKGLNVEIYNLGAPGKGVHGYSEIAEAAIPLLNPDLVIIAVVQGDDLAQSTASPVKNTLIQSTIRRKIIGLFNKFYPNLLQVVRSRVSIKRIWRNQAQKLMTLLSKAEKNRFDNLGASVKNAFFNGELNPYLIKFTIERPSYFLKSMDLNSTYTKKLIKEMSRQFQLIRNVAERNNADVLVISLPSGIYVSEHDYKAHQRIGFILDRKMLETDAPDVAIRSAVEEAGLHFFEVTRSFRETAEDNRYYFELDGHFNASGHKYYAELLAPIVINEIGRLSRNNR